VKNAPSALNRYEPIRVLGENESKQSNPLVLLVGPKSPLFLNAAHFNWNSGSTNVAPMALGNLQTFARAAIVADKNCSFCFSLCSHDI
jgi:hypothetical protein